MSNLISGRLCRIPRRDVTAFHGVVSALPGWLSSEGATDRLSQEFRRRFGYAGAFAVNSGRDGLRMILRAVRGRVPSVAWVPSWTIPAVPQIFEEEGFEVRFIDVDRATLSLTPAIIDRACTEPGLLLVTHYFGLPADMKAICRLAARKNLKIIEDCAHTPAGSCGGRFVGSFGLGGFFSFETRKPLNGLGGGMVVTNNAWAEAALSSLAAPPRRRVSRDVMKLVMTSSEWLMLRRPVFSVASPVLYSRYASAALVGAYRMLHAHSRRDDLAFSDRQAATVLAQLDGLASVIDHKRRLASIYDRLLPPGFTRPVDPPDRPHGYYMYVTTHPRASEIGRRMRELGVDCGIGPEVLQRCDQGRNCPGTVELVETAIELPMYGALTAADCERVCDAARRASND